MVTIESARISALKSRVEGISHLGMESSLGHFSLPLFEKYGVFAVNSNEEEFAYTLDNYIKANISLSSGTYTRSYNLFQIPSYQLSKRTLYYLTDKSGEIFTDQVLDYMKYQSISMATDFLLQSDSLDTYQKEGVDLSNIDGYDNETVDTTVDLSEFSGDTDIKSDLTIEEASSEKSSILEGVKDFLTNASLTLYVKDASKISSETVNLNILPSHKCTFISESSLSSVEKILFIAYLWEKFSSYTTSDLKNDISLNYQMEYILNGGESDDDNLLKCILKIQTLRTGLNLSYLYSDTEKRREARALSSAAVGLIPVPFIVEFTQFAILSAWAAGEAIADIRGLLDGNKIPLFKSKSTWNLQLSNLSSAYTSASSASEEKGLTYEQYLELLIYKSFDTKTVYRTMDLIQLDIKKSIPSFKFTECITGMAYDFTYQFDSLFGLKNRPYTHAFTQIYGY